MNNLTEIISKNTEKIQKHVQEKIEENIDNISKVIEDDIETVALIDPSNNINV